MTDRNPTSEDLFQTYIDTEHDVWGAWSRFEQDLSQPQDTHALGHLIDGCEACVRQMTVLQAATLRGLRAAVLANPLLPAPGRALVERAFRPVLGWLDWQQALQAAWFDMARQVVHRTPT